MTTIGEDAEVVRTPHGSEREAQSGSFSYSSTYVHAMIRFAHPIFCEKDANAEIRRDGEGNNAR